MTGMDSGTSGSHVGRTDRERADELLRRLRWTEYRLDDQRVAQRRLRRYLVVWATSLGVVLSIGGFVSAWTMAVDRSGATATGFVEVVTGTLAIDVEHPLPPAVSIVLAIVLLVAPIASTWLALLSPDAASRLQSSRRPAAVWLCVIESLAIVSLTVLIAGYSRYEAIGPGLPLLAAAVVVRASAAVAGLTDGRAEDER